MIRFGIVTIAFTFTLCFARLSGAQTTRPTSPSVLLVTASGGFVHPVVQPVGGDSLVYETMKELVENRLGGTLTQTGDAATLTADVLDPARTQIVVFYTTGDLPADVPALLKAYLQKGGAMLGVHTATDTALKTAAYTDLIGGIFDGHPWNAGTPVVLRRVDAEHSAVQALGGRLAIKEEIYLHREFRADDVRVLEVLDMEETQQKQPRYVPVVWCRQVGEGRLLYTGLGHRPETWRADWFRQHLTDSMKWLLDDAPGSATPNPRESEREEKLAKAAFQRYAEEQAGRTPDKSPREPRRVPESPNGNSGGGR